VRLPGWSVGPALTAAVLLAFVVLEATVVRIQNPAPIFLIAVTFAGYIGGLRPALVSAAFAIVFSLYYFAVPGHPLTYVPADQARVTSLVLGTTAIAVLTGLLRERLVRAERATARERATAAAREAGSRERQRLFAFLDTAPAAVAYLRGSDHIVELANARFRRGGGGADPVGRPLAEAFPQVDLSPVLAALDQAYESGEAVTVDELAIPYRDTDGTMRRTYQNLVFAPSRDEAGAPEGVFLFASNVTASVEARERLQLLLAEQSAERERLQLILDQLPEGVTISDASGTFILRNRAAETMFPWPDRRVETVIANAEYLHPDGTPYRPDDLPGVRARRGEIVQGEELIVRVREPFHEVPILMNCALLRGSDGTAIGTVSVFQDISGRKRQEAERTAEQQRLRDSETKLRATVEVALDALVAMDTEGRITDWNPSAESIFGRSRSEVIGQEMAAVIIPERYRESHRGGLRRYLETGQGRVIGKRIEIEALHAQGHEFPVELAISAVRTSAGQSFTAFLRDISARRRLEAAQAAALAEVRQALRLRDEFLSAAAHDLKTPLTAISGHLQLIRRRFGDGLAPRVAASLDEVERSATSMNQLINELLDVARLQSGQSLTLDLRDADLVAIARAVVDRAAERTPRHALELRAAAPTLVATVDPARIERVLTNLVDNAMKYSPSGGLVTVAVERQVDAGWTWAVVVVRDQGLGIPAADLPRLFTRFYRSSNTTGISGTGIGLEAARRMVEQHGGTIGVESVEGAGTTVTVRLPLEAVP
jgi:PAS domain S-box-containing protein